MPASNKPKTACYYLGDQKGITLIELLIVVSILASIAFLTSGTFRGVREQANERLVRSEMLEIAKAIRQFKQDTGYYPKTGPFGLVGVGGGAVTYASLPSYAGSSASDQYLWFYSPANFDQILSSVSPLIGTGHQLEVWDAGAGRGWRGPYLNGDDGLVGIGADMNIGPTPAFGNISGNPLLGGLIPDVGGIADPFEYQPVSVPVPLADPDSFLAWSATSGGAQLRSWGRPYLIFGLEAGLNARPRLVSMGPDGILGTADDIILNIE